MKKINGLTIASLLIIGSLMSASVALAYQTCKSMTTLDTSSCGSTCSGSSCKTITYSPACGTCDMTENLFDSCTSTNFTSSKTVQTTSCMPVIGGYTPDQCACGDTGSSASPVTVSCGCVP